MHGLAGTKAVDARRGEGAIVWVMGGAFFASGFAALLYQVIWQRMLGLFAGSDAVTAALVVGAFLLGLGLGSLAAGLFADRLAPRRAAAVFALIEVGIAGFALLSRPFLYDVVVVELGPLMTSRWEVFAVCFAGLLVPTVLMGLSLPVLAKAVVARIETAAHRIGLLYGINTLGAAAGTLIGGFLIVGAIGFEASIRFAAGLNVAAALGALAIRQRLPRMAAPASFAAAAAARAPTALSLRAWTILVFLSGFLIVALEILWVRVLGIAGQGSAYAFPLILGIFLIADGAGLLYGARWVARVRDTRRAFILLQGWAALSAAATLLLLWAIYPLPSFAEVMGIDTFRVTPEALLRLAVLAALLVGPPAFLLGMSFPLVQKAVQRDLASIGFRVSMVQLGNILGNAAGSLVCGLVLLHLVGTAGTTVALTMLAGLMLLWWLWYASDRERRDPLAIGLAASLALAVAVFPGNKAWWARIHAVDEPEESGIVAEDRSGVAVLRLKDGEGPMFITGHTQSRVPFHPHHFLLGAIGPAIHPAPREVMVVGVGSGGTPYAAGWRPETRTVRAVELVQPVYEVIRAYAALHPNSAPAWLHRDARFELATGDGRREIFISGRQWDVIEADAILPQTSHSGMLYSVEFLRLVRDSLKEGGLFVQWAPTRRVVDGFVSVFPHAILLQPISVLIGSTAPIPWDPDLVLERLRSPAFRAWADRARVDPALFAEMINGRPIVWGPETPRRSEDVNTDLFPRDEYYLNNGVEWPSGQWH